MCETSAYSIMCPVARCDPQLAVVDVGGDHLLVASLPVLSSNELHECIVDVSTAREEEAAARTQLMKEEQFLVTPQLAMVSLCSFFLKMFPFFELLTIWE